MKRFAALMLGLCLLVSTAQAQVVQSALPPGVPVKATAVSDARVKATAGKQDEISLDVGEWHVFKFELTQPFVVEADTVFSTDEPPAYHDESGKAVVVFGAKGGPEKVQVRVIQGNKTVYRALVTINQATPTPHISPYIARIQKAYLGDKNVTAADLTRLVAVFADAAKFVDTAKTGKDVWDRIDASYKTNFSNGVLQVTRREIGAILGEQTTSLYGVTLTSADRKAYRQVLTDIQAAVATLGQLPPNPDPGPGPQPIGSHKIYMVVVLESTLTTPGQADLLDDPTLQAKFKSGGHKYLLIDKDVIARQGEGPPPKLKPYLDMAAGKTLPFAILVDQTTGNTLDKKPLPATAPEIIKMLENAGG